MLLADTKGYHLHVFIVCLMKNLPAEKFKSAARICPALFWKKTSDIKHLAVGMDRLKLMTE